MSKVESFEINIPQLGRTRTVWVYLPDSYDPKGEPYPVIYMQDGQNLFYDKFTASGNAWHVDSTLDDIYRKTGRACIVIGVESNDKRRLAEYSPWKVNLFAVRLKRTVAKQRFNRGGEGAKFAEFFAKTLKPAIDSRYNTDKERTATAIVGSGMGAVISCYLALKHQRIYESMGLFSTHIHFNRAAFRRFLRKTRQTLTQHALIYCGCKESDKPKDSNRMVRDSGELYKTFLSRNVTCELVLNSDMAASEQAWGTYFYKFAQDFLQRYYSNKKQ